MYYVMLSNESLLWKYQLESTFTDLKGKIFIMNYIHFVPTWRIIYIFIINN